MTTILDKRKHDGYCGDCGQPCYYKLADLSEIPERHDYRWRSHCCWSVVFEDRKLEFPATPPPAPEEVLW